MKAKPNSDANSDLFGIDLESSKMNEISPFRLFLSLFLAHFQFFEKFAKTLVLFDILLHYCMTKAYVNKV